MTSWPLMPAAPADARFGSNTVPHRSTPDAVSAPAFSARACGRAAALEGFLAGRRPLGSGLIGALRVDITWSTSACLERAWFSLRSFSTSLSSAACAMLCLEGVAMERRVVVGARLRASFDSCLSMPSRCDSSEWNAACNSPASLGKAFLSAAGSCFSSVAIMLPASFTSFCKSFFCASFVDGLFFFSASFSFACCMARACRPFSLCWKSCFSSPSSVGYFRATAPTGRLRWR
mmetsp:Transcript_42829/g.85870  ORF Transcript_42829/g.85870 Transcript_42829/m.85870 type:complete len:233 (-) Transcript_42829:176-874(-)